MGSRLRGNDGFWVSGIDPDSAARTHKRRTGTCPRAYARLFTKLVVLAKGEIVGKYGQKQEPQK